MRGRIQLCILCLLVFSARIHASSGTCVYFSPGLQIFYGSKTGVSWGAKVSIGVVFSNHIVNVTSGILKGDRTEKYGEVQYFPPLWAPRAPLFTGVGLGMCSREGVPTFGARCSLMSGFLLFGNLTYDYFGDKGQNGPEIGSSLVLPIPVYAPDSGIFGGSSQWTF